MLTPRNLHIETPHHSFLYFVNPLVNLRWHSLFFCLSVVCLLFAFCLCLPVFIFCVCVSVLFCIVFVLLKLMVLQQTLFTKAHNMLRFLIETLRELSVIGLMTTRFQKIFASALFGCCKKKYNSRSRIEIEKKNKKRINGIVLPQMHVLESR